MVGWHFHEKAFTEVSYLELVCLDFKGTKLGFCLLKRQTFEILAPYLAGFFISPFSTTFATTTFLWVRQKMDFPFYQCREGITQILKGMGP
jgi:hypothetical protein